MSNCIVCEVYNCNAYHSHEEIKAITPKVCYICFLPAEHNFCEAGHSLDELKNPKAPSAEHVRTCLRISVAYAKLMEHEELQWQKLTQKP